MQKTAVLCTIISIMIASLTLSSFTASAQTSEGNNSPWNFLGQNQQNSWYSPQTIINSSNVATLQQVWSITIPNIDGTPIISNGLVYATSATEGPRYGEYIGNIYAINESTGKLIWTDGPNAQTGLSFSTIAGIAIHDGTLFTATTNSNLVALNATTGALKWQVPITAGLDVNPQATYVGPQGTPLVWNGKIIISNVLGNSVARGFVRAFSESNGALLWTFYTVPRSPMGSTNQGFYQNSWGACTYCGGGDNWNVPSVDPGTGIIYFGTGNPAPYFNAAERSPNPLQYPNLYANSVIALNATNGQMIWYYQQVAGDTHDWDAGMPVQLFNTTINDVQREVVGSGAKNGYYYLLDAATGELIWATSLGIHLNEAQRPTPDGEITYPGSTGGVNTYYTYNPMTNSIYTTVFNLPNEFKSGSIGLAGPGGSDDGVPGVMPNSTLYALNASSGEINWSVNLHGLAGGASSTNNLVFTADASGNYYAFDAQTGALLWNYNSGKSSPFLANWGPPSITDGILFETSFTDNGGVMAFAPSTDNTSPPRAWYDSSWNYAKKITIDQTVIDSDLVDFPLLVNITDTDLGSKAQSDCDDILFTKSDNATKLKHEVENCDIASNWLTAWVRVNVTGSADTILYMYYGNPAAGSQQNVAGTWQSSYELVAHLNDDFLDSTSNNNDGINSGTTDYPNQHIADSQSFDGINNSITFGTDMPNDVKGTVSLWVRPTDTAKDSYITTSASDDLAIVMGYLPEDNFFDIYDDATYPCGQTNMQMPATNNAWQLIAYSYDDTSNDVYGFKNGALVKSNLNCSIEGEKTFLVLGSYYSGADYLQGQIDEFRFSTDFYSNDDWFKARYECERGGGGCITIGNEGTNNQSNKPPVAADDVVSTKANNPVTIPVLANDSDPDGDSLTVTSVTTPSFGTSVINPDNTVRYTPNQDFAGQDSFSYSISDGRGGSDSALVTVNVPAPTAPSPPQNLQATAGFKNVTLSWQAPSSDGGSPVTNYRIFRSTSSGTETFLTKIGNVTSYTNTGLVPGVTYFYKVKAVNAVNSFGSSFSNEASATTITVPSVPQNLQATAGFKNVTLSWQAPSSDGGSPVTNYRIFRSTSSGTETFLIKIGNVTSYTNTGLTGGVTYFYKVKAVNAVDQYGSSFSNESSATPS